MDWKFHQQGNCLASWGLSSDAKQLSWVMKFSVYTLKTNFQFEPKHHKANKMACATSKDWSACSSAQSDQSLLSAWKKTLGPYIPIECTAKSLIRLGTGHFVGFVMLLLIWLLEPPHDKTNKMACAPNKDSDQPGHPPSLIRVFAVRMKKVMKFLVYTLTTNFQFEPKHHKANKMACATSKNWSACSSAQSDQSAVRMKKKTLGPYLPIECTAKSLIRLGTGHFVGFVMLLLIWILEPPHDKTNKMACAPNKGSDQPGHPPSLIRVFAVCMKKAWVLSYPLSAQWRLLSDWADAQADLCLHWAHSHFVGFVMKRLK